MPLTTGTRIAHYEITGAIGAGGMGEVFRATDTRLNRSVAITTLPEILAAEADRVARFRREAQVTGQGIRSGGRCTRRGTRQGRS